jgi:hypothetical protein
MPSQRRMCAKSVPVTTLSPASAAAAARSTRIDPDARRHRMRGPLADAARQLADNPRQPAAQGRA